MEEDKISFLDNKDNSLSKIARKTILRNAHNYGFAMLGIKNSKDKAFVSKVTNRYVRSCNNAFSKEKFNLILAARECADEKKQYEYTKMADAIADNYVQSIYGRTLRDIVASTEELKFDIISKDFKNQEYCLSYFARILILKSQIFQDEKVVDILTKIYLTEDEDYIVPLIEIIMNKMFDIDADLAIYIYKNPHILYDLITEVINKRDFLFMNAAGPLFGKLSQIRDTFQYRSLDNEKGYAILFSILKSHDLLKKLTPFFDFASDWNLPLTEDFEELYNEIFDIVNKQFLLINENGKVDSEDLKNEEDDFAEYTTLGGISRKPLDKKNQDEDESE